MKKRKNRIEDEEKRMISRFEENKKK